MTYAYWYLFAVMLLPYCFTVLAKMKHPNFNNRTPRDFLESLEGWRKRSHWAQLNSFEIFPGFAAAVIIAHLCNANQAHIDVIALSFFILRVLYGIFYIGDRPALRSLAWFGSLLCIIALFVLAAQ